MHSPSTSSKIEGTPPNFIYGLNIISSLHLIFTPYLLLTMLFITSTNNNLAKQFKSYNFAKSKFSEITKDNANYR